MQLRMAILKHEQVSRQHMDNIRMMKSRRMRWGRHVARMGIGYWWESQKERDH
jgi:hypothetical protein